MEPVRILTYNIHSGIGNNGSYSLDRIAAVIRRSGADIACLQEVEFNSAMLKTRKWSAVHSDKQPMLIAKASGLNNWNFVGPLAAHVEDPLDSHDHCCQGEILVRDPKNEAVYGNAILSRFPILDRRTLLFQQQDPPLSASCIYMDREEQPRGACAVLVDISSDHGGEAAVGQRAAANAPRGALSCCMAAPVRSNGSSPAAPLWVVTTHLSHKPSSEEQRRQARQLLEWIDGICDSYEGPVKPGYVLCGDFNSPPFLPASSFSEITSDGRWKDFWQERGTLCCQATFPSACGTTACGVRIDHIVGLEADKAARLLCEKIRILGDPQDGDASDHFAVVADLVVKC